MVLISVEKLLFYCQVVVAEGGNKVRLKLGGQGLRTGGTHYHHHQSILIGSCTAPIELEVHFAEACWHRGVDLQTGQQGSRLARLEQPWTEISGSGTLPLVTAEQKVLANLGTANLPRCATNETNDFEGAHERQ